jgi:beta-lactamase class D
MTKTITSILSFLLVLVITSPARSEDTDLAKLFADKKIDGTIIISDLTGSKTYAYNERRAHESFVPASTFKILNTLIALEEGVVSEKDIIKWDGKDKGVAAWNRDQTLETAFKSSCVWFYQELAQGIGTAGYKAYFNRLKYGTGMPLPDLRTFWLEGDLRISAVEQVDFLKKIYRRELPFRRSSYEILKKMMLIEKAPAYTLRAKTGWAQRTKPQTGWYVGYVETADKVWFFATNIEIKKPEDARFRQELTLEALRLKGII